MRCPFESAAITSSHSPVVSVSIVSLAEQHFHEFDSDDDGLLMDIWDSADVLIEVGIGDGHLKEHCLLFSL